MKKRRVIVTVASGIFLALLYFVIFHFSAQDGDASGSLSRGITERCAAFLNFLSGGRLSDAEVRYWASCLEYPVRKTAHFAEYACMGMLVYILWSQWLRQGKGLYALTLLWVFLSAAGDEFHQLFVPGRAGSFSDVLLDTAGGMAGMLVCIGCLALWRRRAKKAAAARN